MIGVARELCNIQAKSIGYSGEVGILSDKEA